MSVINHSKFITHLFGPDCHGQESQRRIIQAVIVLVRVLFHPIVEREITAEKSWPRIGGRFVGRQPARLLQAFVAPVKTVDDVVLITDVPRIFPDPSTQLNPCEENRRHQKRHENAPDKIASTRRSYSETQKRSNAHSPKRRRQKLISTGYSSFCSKLRVPKSFASSAAAA